MSNTPCRLKVIVCRGPTCGEKRGSNELFDHLRQALDARGLSGQVTLGRESCFGQCQRGPNILVCDNEDGRGRAGGFGAGAGASPSGVLYNRMSVVDLEKVIERHLVGGMVVRPFLNRPPVNDG